jgi:hypothetical protein
MEQKTLDIFKQTVVEENDQIWIKPLCDFFELDVRNQHKKIKNDPILKKLVGKNTPVFGEIDKNGRILLTKKGFTRWIQLINHNTVREDLRDSFVQYQTMIFDYLYGSAQEHVDARRNYTRLQKLERLYGKIGNEIKREKQNLHDHWNRRYMQTTISFPDRKQIAQ